MLPRQPAVPAKLCFLSEPAAKTTGGATRLVEAALRCLWKHKAGSVVRRHGGRNLTPVTMHKKFCCSDPPLQKKKREKNNLTDMRWAGEASGKIKILHFLPGWWNFTLYHRKEGEKEKSTRNKILICLIVFWYFSTYCVDVVLTIIWLICVNSLQVMHHKNELFLLPVSFIHLRHNANSIFGAKEY